MKTNECLREKLEEEEDDERSSVRVGPVCVIEWDKEGRRTKRIRED
jgi:hypothetical protein